MKVVSLCSGSKGNSTYLEINHLKILIDTGKTYKYINDSLNLLNVNISEINYIFITHNHSDHVSALKGIMKYTNAKLCITKELYDSLKDKPTNDKVIYFENEIIINKIKFTALNSSHDAPECKNYVIEFNNKKISLITDSGYLKQNQFKYFYNSDIFLMESNYDIDLLQNGKYPHYLKQRILGDEGHLSNEQSGFYLSKIIGNNTKKILLIHLSEENNNPIVALKTVKDTLLKYNLEFYDIDYARQFEISEVMELD